MEVRALELCFHSWKVESGFLVVLAVLLVSQSGFGEAPDLSKFLERGDTAQRLEKGDLILFKGAKFDEVFGDHLVNSGRRSLVLFLVSKPPVTTWSLLSDFDEHYRFMPRVTESKVEWNKKNEYYIRYRYEVLWTDSTNYLFARCDDDTMTLLWRLDAKRCDNRVDGINAFWNVQEYDDRRTLVAIFRSIKQSSALNSFASKLLVSPRSGAKAVRRHIESSSKQAD